MPGRGAVDERLLARGALAVVAMAHAAQVGRVEAKVGAFGDRVQMVDVGGASLAAFDPAPRLAAKMLGAQPPPVVVVAALGSAWPQRLAGSFPFRPRTPVSGVSERSVERRA
jgi:hypothetical protein